MGAAASQPAVLTSGSSVPPERGMRWLLGALIALFIVGDILDIPMSMGPGLSAKNALLYVIAVALVLKLIVQQPFVFNLRALHVCFAILIAYSLLSVFTAYFVVQYPRYSLIGSGITWKTKLVDQAILFLVFFYGLRETRNAYTLLKVLLIAVIIGNTIALLNAVGLTEIGGIGEMETRKSGRMTGIMGEPNVDAAFISLFLPALGAALILSRGLWRAWWFGGMIFSLGVIVLTASRGGFVAMIVSALWGVVVFRRYVSLARLAAFASGAAVLVIIVFSVMSIEYGGLLYERFIADSTGSDMVAASSGRLEIWSHALALMSEKPLTFLTGYGWNVYWSLPTRLSPHNHYLSLWFNVGLVGLICGISVLVLVIREAMAALPYSPPQYRPVLISFAIGAVAISVAAFFVDLIAPWLWFWAYAGFVMRIAVNLRSQSEPKQAIEPVSGRKPRPHKDPFGWVGTVRQ